MDSGKKNILKFNRADGYMPQPEILEVKKKRSNFTIGVPKEITYQETRIAIAPEAVGTLVNNGHKVYIESNAGKAAHFPDHEYSEAGGIIVYSPEDVYRADIILKVAPLTINEIEYCRQRQVILSALHLPGQTEEYFKKLISKKITAISYEHIKDKTNSFPIIRSLSEIVGTTAIFIAAEYLAHPEYGRGKMLGGSNGITPAEIVIIGAGTVGEYAARAALGLGSIIKVFDDSIYKLRSIQYNVNARFFTSIIQQKVLVKTLRTADVVIGALHSSEGKTPCVISEDMIREMQSGSVIIDISITQGGCFETSRVTNHSHPVFKKHGVTHYCVPNIASRVPHTASYAFSNYFTPIIVRIGNEGGIDNIIKTDQGIRNGVYMYQGILTNKYVSDTYYIPFQDINLLIAAFH